MKKLFVRIRHVMRMNNLLAKIIISYILIGALLLMALSYFLLISFSESANGDINDLSRQMLSQSEKVSDMLLTYTYNYYNNLFSSDTTVFKGLYESTFDYRDIASINETLTNPILSNPLVHSVYLYNATADLVFSSIATMKSAKEFEDFDGEIVHIIKGTASRDLIKVVPRQIESKILLTSSYQSHVLTVLFLRNYPDKPPNAALVVNIDQKALQDMITERKPNSGNEVYIVNKDGMIISHQSPQKIGIQAPGEIVDYLLTAHNPSGVFELKNKSHDMHVTYLKSERWGWYFVSVADKKMILLKLNMLRRNILIVTGLFMLAAVIGGLFFTRMIYTPLQELIRKMRKTSSVITSRSDMNEYDYLVCAYDGLVERIENLKTAMPVKRNQVLQSIIMGEYASLSQITKDIGDLNIRLGSGTCLVCVFRMDGFRLLAVQHQQELSLLRFVIESIVRDVFNDHFVIETVDMGGDHVCAIVNVDEENDGVLSVMKHLLEQSQYYIQQYYKISVTASVGGIAEDVTGIHNSYKNAFEASDYRIIRGKGSVILFREISKSTDQHYQYPQAKEKQVLDALRLGDLDRVSRAVDSFICEISPYSYGEIMLSSNQLAVVSNQLIRGLIEDVEKHNIDFNYRSINANLSRCDTIYEIKEWFMDFYCKFINAVKSKNDHRKDEVVRRMESYLNSNYTNRDLSIDLVANLVGFSPNYVRTLFKEKMNVSISDYISRLRFDKAKELLGTTNYPASRISDMIGFYNNKYFFVAFKKITGKTPDQYRKDLLPES